MTPTNIQYRIHTQFIIVVTLILLGLVFYLVSPFIATLFIAAVIVTALNPVHRWLQKKIKSRFLCAMLMWVGIVLLFVIPSTVLIWLLLKETAGVSTQISNAATQLPSYLDTLPEKIAPYLPAGSQWQNQLSSNNLSKLAADVFSQMSTSLLRSATSFITGLSLLFLHLIIFLFALFYLLFDGNRLLKYVKKLLPLAEKQKKELVQKSTDLMQSIIYGIFGAALAQGSLVGVGLTLIGVPNPIFWGTIAILLAPMPYVGVGLIWVPVVLWLFATSQWGAGIFFLAWCLIFVINIDNIIKPYLIGARSLLHPFAVMLVILGGVLTLGFKGLIFGPLILTLLIAFLHIYQLEFASKKIDPRKSLK
ncbi:AI-2E family transporter [bacterium]|nr:AI-2E family transporter [bacterium]NCQ55724.1 AI-2E family transporter [Candidatus Parcubacteria bacterium]NCS67673.1 AI-2E family transporter [Candidatus Peregrinibacteria bacterium]NCS96687.1 AI-2E family transporter [bacterium]